MGKRLRNKGKANLPTAISKCSVCMGYRADGRYKDSKVCNYYYTRANLTGL